MRYLDVFRFYRSEISKSLNFVLIFYGIAMYN